MAKAELRKPKPKSNPLKAADVTVIDYKDVALLRKFISDRGKIRARRVTGVTVQEQRKIAQAIKNAREVALLPYSGAGRGCSSAGRRRCPTSSCGCCPAPTGG